MCSSPNIQRDRWAYLQSILEVQVVDNLGTYLGLSSVFSKRNKDGLNKVKDIVWKVLHGWKISFFFFFNGRQRDYNQECKLFYFSMGVFYLPKTLCNDTSKISQVQLKSKEDSLDEMGKALFSKRARRFKFSRPWRFQSSLPRQASMENDNLTSPPCFKGY